MNLPNLPYKKRLASLALASLLSGAAFYTTGMSEAAIPPPETTASQTVAPAQNVPVDFEASTVEYDDAGQKITAEGAVEIVQKGRIIKAERVVYDLKSEQVTAEGNVAILEENGDVHFFDKAELSKDMKNGYVKKLRSVLADGSRFTAEEGHRVDGKKTIMDNATYTPCEPCKLHPEKPPVWQIRADKVTHNSDEHTITYKNATFEAAGIPVMYVPYFSHTDGTIKQKSGFLTPTFNLSSDLGFSATPRYYWAIDPTQDATLGIRSFIEQTPMAMAEYRKRFDNGKLEFNGGFTQSDFTDMSGTQKEHVDNATRSYLFGKGLWDINQEWRAGFNTAVVSDNQFLRQYDINSEDVLENQLYAERFENRNYAVVRALAFQDIRTSERATDQPNILPEAIVSFLGDPGDTFGGRWSLDMSALGLTRNGNGQDVIRGSTTAGWQRQDILDIGLVNVFYAGIRGDAYSVPTRDDELLGSGEGDSTSARFFPTVHNLTSYPLVNNLSDYQLVVEPSVGLTAVTNVNNDTDIPNEDSQDVQIDVNNLFDADRFPGLDRVEDKSHATYGVRTGVHTPDGSKGEFFFGQSYRLDKDDNPFPEGSGLDNRSSDYVGEVDASYMGNFNLDYRFDLSSEDFQSQRHELDANAVIDNLSLSTSYFYAQSLDGTDLTSTREQLYGGITYGFTDEWIGSASGRYDLSEETKGLRALSGELKYLGQCYTIATTVEKNFTYESSGDNGTEVMLRVGLRNLGELGTSE